MASNPKKRTLTAFFAPVAKRRQDPEPPRDSSQASSVLATDNSESESETKFTELFTYPFRIRHLPDSLSLGLTKQPTDTGRVIDNQPDLDLLYFEGFISKPFERQLFKFLRAELPFYRVEYKIKRGGFETQIRTPRYTTVFGLDESSRFDDNGRVVDTATRTQLRKDNHYEKYKPRPIPECLDRLRQITEEATKCKFNFCLVNYYASGSDSISYHSDDERFLGPLPAIASLSLGARRDFLMKHKPFQPDDSKPPPPATEPLKLPLNSGDMVLMQGRTQANWLHSIPKRSGKNLVDGGRINITFRKALIPAGTENYYNYNVGTGQVFRWDENSQQMQSRDVQ